jgi:putative flippase GtrA
VALVRLGQKGRGRALKQVWLASDAPILAYMDVDLSTDLDALWPLVAPLMSGHSDVAIGSRLAQGARVVRGTKREVISRCYNLVLRATLGARFTDAQCGFKAIRSDVAAELLPLVEDTTWFFDTELLVLAQRSGLRIHEVPVDWFDDPDSRVDVVGTALDDLRGVVRVRRSLASGRLPVAAIEARIGRHPPGSRGDGAGAWQQLTRFAAVGAASTVLHLGLFAALAPPLGSTQTANLVALVLATVANTAMNRRWTFRVHGAGAVRHQLQGLSIFALTWLLTAGALGLLHTVVSNPGTALATMVVAMATAASTGLRFVAMRSWMFRSEARFSESPSGEPQYSVTMNVPSSSSNTTTPVQSQPSTEPWHTVTSP